MKKKLFWKGVYISFIKAIYRRIKVFFVINKQTEFGNQFLESSERRIAKFLRKFQQIKEQICLKVTKRIKKIRREKIVRLRKDFKKKLKIKKNKKQKLSKVIFQHRKIAI